VSAVSIVADRDVRKPAAAAGTAMVQKPFLPTTKCGWLCAVTIVVVIIILASLGWLTNGRAGLIGVTGNSMSSVMPQGSSVVTLPLPPRESDFVVALAGTPDDQSDTTSRDGSRSLVVKQYHRGRLVSTDDANVYSRYEYRGRVVARIQTQKILFWRDKGSQKPATAYSAPTTQQKIVAVNQSLAERGRDKRIAEEARRFYSEWVGGVWSSPDIEVEKVIDGSDRTKIAFKRDALLEFRLSQKRAVKVMLRGYTESPEGFIVNGQRVVSVYQWAQVDVDCSKIVVEVTGGGELVDVLLLPSLEKPP